MWPDVPNSISGHTDRESVSGHIDRKIASGIYIHRARNFVIDQKYFIQLLLIKNSVYSMHKGLTQRLLASDCKHAILTVCPNLVNLWNLCFYAVFDIKLHLI